ncbi:tRNA (adenosine(37)-N6)-threonylcarbamoyltransferase complex ATPase subunit type 1 TsaE [Candidatus Dependentiae bacterium]|nr:tRNA (adenosine(37)-N6)-threonylcarbamoyltransferase complex ATPase subunit type 1 TsaE [Candidatus Dependentiae bacterium]
MKQTKCDVRLVYSLDELKKAVDHVYDHMKNCKVITLTGSLGAGKTTLVRALLRKCGITEEITSPTFVCVNSYKNKKGITFNHFDLYRIKLLDEFVESGFDEYLYAPKSIALIEWPDIIMPHLEKDVCHITLEYNGADERILSCSLKGCDDK